MILDTQYRFFQSAGRTRGVCYAGGQDTGVLGMCLRKAEGIPEDVLFVHLTVWALFIWRTLRLL